MNRGDGKSPDNDKQEDSPDTVWQISQRVTCNCRIDTTIHPGARVFTLIGLTGHHIVRRPEYSVHSQGWRALQFSSLPRAEDSVFVGASESLMFSSPLLKEWTEPLNRLLIPGENREDPDFFMACSINNFINHIAMPYDTDLWVCSSVTPTLPT